MDEHATYIIRATTNGWALCLNGQRLTSYETFSEVSRTTMTAGKESRRQGMAVEICKQAKTVETLLILRAGPELIGHVPLPASANGGQRSSRL